MILKKTLALSRSLYEWVMKWSSHKQAFKALCALSFTEAIFFPIPVDPFLVTMGASQPKKALWYGFWATFFSVFGGVFGYLIGFYFWELFQDFFYTYLFSEAKLELVLLKFRENAFLSIFLAGLTPIPYKVFTVASGLAQIDWTSFLLGSFLGRSLRFVTEGTLLFFYGRPIKAFIDQHFERITLITGIVIVLGVVICKFFC